ncbi:Uncharacterized protein SCF082_LOCUS50161 [Durusdinium trenchii]|uniref:Uncharacterized protein n=1 Tax=Durusdinium trenchii TaxID=1381693 RepID=A0ABP0S626_9DINO
MALLQNAHMEIGKMYCYPKEHGQKPFQLTKVNDDNAEPARAAQYLPRRAHQAVSSQCLACLLPVPCSCTKAMALYTQQSFKKKQLKLVPLGTVTKAKEGLQSKLRIQCQGMAFTICAWKQSTDFNDGHCLVPFFGAKPTTEEEAVTLEWSHVVQDGISIPILTNNEALGKHQLLLYPKESQEKETSGDTKQPPKKKSRK